MGPNVRPGQGGQRGERLVGGDTGTLLTPEQIAAVKGSSYLEDYLKFLSKPPSRDTNTQEDYESIISFNSNLRILKKLAERRGVGRPPRDSISQFTESLQSEFAPNTFSSRELEEFAKVDKRKRELRAEWEPKYLKKDQDKVTDKIGFPRPETLVAPDPSFLAARGIRSSGQRVIIKRSGREEPFGTKEVKAIIEAERKRKVQRKVPLVHPHQPKIDVRTGKFTPRKPSPTTTQERINARKAGEPKYEKQARAALDRATTPERRISIKNRLELLRRTNGREGQVGHDDIFVLDRLRVLRQEQSEVSDRTAALRRRVKEGSQRARANILEERAGGIADRDSRAFAIQQARKKRNEDIREARKDKRKARNDALRSRGKLPPLAEDFVEENSQFDVRGADWTKGLTEKERRARGFNLGGGVPGSGNLDTVPAMLTPGEFVVNKEGTRKNRIALQAMNRGKKVRNLQDGTPPETPGIGGGVLILSRASQFALNGFNQAAQIMVPSLQGFANAVTLLNQAAQSIEALNIPDTIQITVAPIQHSVNINGAEALAQIEPAIIDLVTAQIHKAIGESINTITGETQERHSDFLRGKNFA